MFLKHWTKFPFTVYATRSLTHSIQKAEKFPLGTIDSLPAFIWILILENDDTAPEEAFPTDALHSIRFIKTHTSIFRPLYNLFHLIYILTFVYLNKSSNLI